MITLTFSKGGRQTRKCTAKNGQQWADKAKGYVCGDLSGLLPKLYSWDLYNGVGGRQPVSGFVGMTSILFGLAILVGLFL